MKKPCAQFPNGASKNIGRRCKTLVYAWLFQAFCLNTGCRTIVQNAAGEGTFKKIAFSKQTLTKDFIADGVAVGDVNKDGLVDVLAGAYWFEAPDWVPHEIMKPEKFAYDKGYSDAFISQTMDVNFDGWSDFLRIGFPGKEAFWFKNPQGKSGHWKKHLIHDAVGNGSAGFYDIDGDGRLDLLGGNSAKKQMTWFKAPSFADLGKTDPSALVRLYLTSAMQRTAPENRWEIMEALLQRAEDKDDHHLPLMLWYAFEPAVPTNVNRAVDLALKAKVPHILPFTIQRLGAIKSAESIKALQDLQQRVENTQDSHQNHEIQTLLKKALASN